MDTKWKKYKYSGANKALCVLIACFFAAALMLNIMSLVKYAAFFEDNLFNSDKVGFYSSYVFKGTFSMDIDSVFYYTNIDADNKMYEAAKAEYVEEGLAAYKEAEQKCRKSADEIEDYQSSYDYAYDEDYAYYETTTSYYSNGYYEGDNGYYYTKTFRFDNFGVTDNISDGMNFGHSDETAMELLESYYGRTNESPLQDYYRIRNNNYENLKNIQYYAENADGTVVTNVSDKDTFINSVKSGTGDYIAYEAGHLSYSSNLDGAALYSGLAHTEIVDCNMYFLVNSEFAQDDMYAELYADYQEACDININFVIANMIISVIGMIAFAVVSCRLAGHTEQGVSIALLDKLPADFHFALMGASVAAIVTGTTFLICEYSDTIGRYGWVGEFSVNFFKTIWPSVLFAGAGIAVYLLILSFAASLSRALKAGLPIFKNLLIVRLIILIWKIFVFIFKTFFKFCKMVLRGIVKICRGIAKFFGTIGFKPKKLNKMAVITTILYTLFNAFSFIIIALLVCAYDGFANFCGGLGILVLLGIDAFLIYKAVRYMKALDDVISTSEKREPLPYSADKLPESLRVLANSLEATNAELQNAVIKAVKDERTKTELITNVSHDLKTPLTSVINYIDLLQKCNIEDEDAKKYMQVIDEKSKKLKRLIEDLIEASKVSSGNVTINKTKLNLNELAAQAVVEEQTDIEKNNLQLVFEESTVKHIVFADGTKIYRVFENLLSNARKYSAPGSRVYARVYSDDKFGYFEIKNISKEPLNISADELTERFVRGDKSRSEDGNGLGLSIAKELCRLNDGELIIKIDGDLFKATVKIPKEE
ncbi:MAG: HAMP domain-containing histidine kinase [Eubacterium sp.]|nr:HAMP domain-containing histidine kinase [Eubacterium sp.]